MRRLKKVWKQLLLFMAVAAVFFLMPAGASAEEESILDIIPKEQTFELMNPVTTYLITLDEGCTVKNLKSSKKSVATVEYLKENGSRFLQITPKKAGVTKITFTYKYAGKTTKRTLTITVKKYANPCKTLKIGSKSYASKFKNTSFYSVNRKVSGKLNVKAKSGWKLCSMTYCNLNTGKTKNIKNGSKVTLSKGSQLQITFVNKSDPSRYLNLFLGYY